VEFTLETSCHKKHARILLSEVLTFPNKQRSICVPRTAVSLFPSTNFPCHTHFLTYHRLWNQIHVINFLLSKGRFMNVLRSCILRLSVDLHDIRHFVCTLFVLYHVMWSRSHRVRFLLVTHYWLFFDYLQSVYRPNYLCRYFYIAH
jgi:hypothetical protein